MHRSRVALWIALVVLAGCWPTARAQNDAGGMGNGPRPRTAATEPAPKTDVNRTTIRLEDITASTGIHFDHLSTPEQKFIVESMSGGVALIDYDRDGWPDIYFTNSSTVEMALAGKSGRSALFHNNHDGTFTDVTEKAGVGNPCWANGVVVGDYNNDGWPDLLVTCFGGVVLYRNNGDGTFTDVTKAAGLGGDTMWAAGATFGDYDNDGWADLFVSHYVDFNLKDLPAFGSSKTCKFRGIDVQCGPKGLKGSPDNLYHNNHDGTFTDVSKQTGVDDPQHFFGLTSVWEDFDNRGKLDLFVTNDGEMNYLYKNEGNGHFTDVALMSGVAVDQNGAAQANMGVALGDYLHTGRFSIAISHFSDEYMALYQNDGGMNFSDVSDVAGITKATTPYVGWGDGFFDFDNDGWVDLFLVNGHVYPQIDNDNAGDKYKEPKLLFLNNHDGTFSDVSKQVGPALQIPQVSRGVAIGDLFNDGSLCVVVENLKGEPMILRARGVKNHWIGFELQGVQSNRLALNARVRVTAAGMTQLDEVHSGGSYLSQHDLRLHFGLASADHADKVEVIWPSGKVDVLGPLRADHIYSVLEGKGVVPFEEIRPKSVVKK
jgi:enediyne biosynthesis protein E4